MRDLTDEEIKCAQLLGDAWNLHQKLPQVHSSDEQDFAAAIHAAQNIILARPATEAVKNDARVI
jgi:hypothetical protein